MVDLKHTKVHLFNSKNVQHGPVQAGRQVVMGNKPMSYAQAAQGDWNIVVPKRGKAAVQNKPHKPEKLVQALYPKAEREIVVHFDKYTGFIPTNKLARDALDTVNRALVDNKDVLSPPFLCSRFSRNNNLVFTTGFNHNNMDYGAYSPIICNALASIGPATAVINEQWSKFLVHGVPTYTTKGVFDSSSSTYRKS
jgi:hypothetical protein